MEVTESESQATAEAKAVMENVAQEVGAATGFEDMLDKLSLSGYERNLLARNDGRGHFENIASLVGADTVLDSRSVGSADFDGDGDLDLVLRNFNNPRLLYLENVYPTPGRWLRVRLAGPAGNPTGVGATVRLESGDHVQIQTVTAGAGFMTQLSDVLHFGLGERTAVDRLVVRWPDGEEQVVEGPTPGQTLRITR